ncbi:MULTISPECIES: ABC transporter ATP-binding protein [Flavobacteriaceae]|uniref:ABC transporter ATP-binding protein n=1 Tax=Flavobacteriaceae TaxID=49546 RepID=UPI000564DD06|nr:ABC transporter ATP-binding protein [Flavimarina sp. Hel_I_48]MEC7785212.1 ABC transporter ATP-binding protein [Bacteroidota bacterium]
MHKLALEHIAHSYGDKETLNDLSFSFERGKTTCLLGPSGCGKTTVLRLIAGLEEPSDGAVKIEGTIVSGRKEIIVPPHKRKIGFIFQDLALWPHFNVYENIAFGPKEKKQKNIKSKVVGLLDLFGIGDKISKYPHELSGGQKQMVALARSLAMQPEILLMDEPLANIDTHLKESILQHLKTVQRERRFTLLYVTHDHREAMKIADYIIVMEKGKIAVAGTKAEIRNSSTEFVKSFLNI